MRICFSSDIHIDCHDLNLQLWKLMIERCKNLESQVLIIAGDFCESLDRFEEGLALASDLKIPKLFVPGNHDLWVRQDPDCDSEEKLNTLLPEVCERQGWHYLPGQPFDYRGVQFVGSCCWYDYSLMPENHPFSVSDFLEKQRAGRRWMDGIYTRFPSFQSPTPDHDLCQKFYQELEVDLQKLDQENSTVLVTHFPFYREFLNFTGKNWEFEYFGAYMGSELYRDLLQKYPIKHHICGHLHRLREIEVEKCTVHLNPAGYYREWETQVPEDWLEKALKFIEV